MFKPDYLLSASVLVARSLVALSFLLCTSLVAQSPFNYGTNDSIYFVSKAKRQSTGLQELTSVYVFPQGETGGMWENGDVNTILFDTSEVQFNWSTAYLSSGDTFNLDSVLASAQFVNGSLVNLNGDRLSTYGGYGYGSFDVSDYFWKNDTVALKITYCAGHCGEQRPSFSKVFYHKDGRPKCEVFYAHDESDYWIDDSTSLEQFDTEMERAAAFSFLPSSQCFRYTAQHLFAGIGEEEFPASFFEFSYEAGQFQQVLAGNETLENWAQQHLHMLPKLLLFEVYQNGVVAFLLNRETKKYFRGRIVVLN